IENAQKVEGFLGEGRFGIVTKCRNTKTNKVVAIKKLRGLDADRCNIVKWNDFFIDGDRICLNFELLNESLWRYQRSRVLPIREIRPVLFQLANALSHLGSLGIVHADLKPGNIMVVDRYECPIKVKLIDFGFACPTSTVTSLEVLQRCVDPGCDLKPARTPALVDWDWGPLL
uniref:Protein kinase domain-containing protein n=1 Tax=Neolamprologus brichardi TaxID=32507 RepID=A0A3Q4MAH9_NEOBR